ncbi:hypothetical protein U8P80_01430 [Rhizobium beringeri]|nr:hypothetical protein U8P80_01430 [Rhizobium beringeri]WSH14741.1 hypothetical protein U8P74_01430 [Rhizobium beringeri]
MEFGDTVVFLPEHVISLDREGADAARRRQHDTELGEIVEEFIQEAELEDIEVDDVKLILNRLEDESDRHPEKTHTEVWDSIVEGLNLGDTVFSVARAIWSAAHFEDEGEDEGEGEPIS